MSDSSESENEHMSDQDNDLPGVEPSGHEDVQMANAGDDVDYLSDFERSDYEFDADRFNEEALFSEPEGPHQQPDKHKGGDSGNEDDYSWDQRSPHEQPPVEPDVQVPEVNEEPRPASVPSEVKSQTVAEFIGRSKDLLNAGDMDVFAQYVLTGVHDNIQHQVDPIKDAVNDNLGIQVLRDYDSVLGVHDNICVNAALTIYPVSKFEDTFKRNIHIKQLFRNQFVRIYSSHLSSSIFTTIV